MIPLTLSTLTPASLSVGVGQLWFALSSGAALTTLFGILLLYVGAEVLVKGAKSLSITAGIPAAVVGVTVVAFGTTTPELFVGIVSSFDYNTTLAIGAIVGSNVANIGLVLGLSALVSPLAVDWQTVRRDVPAMVGAAVLLAALSSDGWLSRTDGLILLAALAVYTVFLYRSVAANRAADRADADAVATDGGTVSRRSALFSVAFVVVGLALLLYGSRNLVSGGTHVMHLLGAGNRLVGLTVLALGTSLPELATSLVSAVRGDADFAVGNVVGSNIYNILAVLGIAATANDIMVAGAMRTFDIPVLLAFTAAAVTVLVVLRRVGRLAGLALVAGYLAYATTLI